MKIIFDNIIFSLQKAGGISVYWYELAKRLKNNEDITFYESKNSNLFSKSLKLNSVKEESIPVGIRRYLPFIKFGLRKTLFHSSYYRFGLGLNVKNVVTVHDFTYEYFRSGLPRFIHSFQKKMAILFSEGVICISENTKKDLLKFIPSAKNKNVVVIYNGVSKKFHPVENPSLPKELEGKRYILYVGDRKSEYKNFSSAVDIIKNIPGLDLVLVGGGGLTSLEKQKYENYLDRIIHFGGIESEDLNLLYNGALCLIYPSNYEGFGIPLIEAMKAQCPLVAKNIGVVKEVTGGFGILCDEDCYVDSVKSLLEGSLSYDLTEACSFAQKYSWETCFEKTNSFYKSFS